MEGGGGGLEGVVAPRAHRVRTVAIIGGQTPVHHPEMHPPKQPHGTLEKINCKHTTGLPRIFFL